MNIGILAVQGAFREHKQAFEDLGTKVTEVRLANQLENLDALVIPGGESSTMAKLMKNYGLDIAIQEFYKSGAAIWGTCAGAIAVAKEIADYPEQAKLSLVDMTVERNSYGRQIASFETDIKIEGFKKEFHAIFIRAPRIVQLSKDVKVLASYKSDPIMVVQNKVMATVFHPELTQDRRIHEYFVENLVKNK
ncbi:MAG TPA: pyridoxal 5'-phosphate synthase glutaminase subunit PdxT [Trueperaceae bacterium]|nr:pyridoxal 5'-phosphate synthase glutaminase subunit PdxT [Trueperaceae bacterium]